MATSWKWTKITASIGVLFVVLYGALFNDYIGLITVSGPARPDTVIIEGIAWWLVGGAFLVTLILSFIEYGFHVTARFRQTQDIAKSWRSISLRYDIWMVLIYLVSPFSLSFFILGYCGLLGTCSYDGTTGIITLALGLIPVFITLAVLNGIMLLIVYVRKKKLPRDEQTHNKMLV